MAKQQADEIQARLIESLQMSIGSAFDKDTGKKTNKFLKKLRGHS